MSNELGHQLGIWTLLPFVLMLLGIAILPLVAERWFEPNRNKAIVSAVLGVPTLIYLFAQFGSLGVEAAADTAVEYVSFIILLLALYTISGGIYLTGNLVATPRVNLTFLVVGAVLASFVGTMGASMLLIRPLLRANSERTHARHTVVFFIFAVSNMGGMLTPLGRPSACSWASCAACPSAGRSSCGPSGCWESAWSSSRTSPSRSTSIAGNRRRPGEWTRPTTCPCGSRAR